MTALAFFELAWAITFASALALGFLNVQLQRALRRCRRRVDRDRELIEQAARVEDGMTPLGPQLVAAINAKLDGDVDVVSVVLAEDDARALLEVLGERPASEDWSGRVYGALTLAIALYLPEKNR